MTLPDLAGLVREAATDDLPLLIGRLEAAKAAAWARITVARVEPSPAVPEAADELLTPTQAAEAIGGVTVKWLYRHTKGLRFRRDLSRKVVRFERAGLLRWMATRKG